MSKGKRKSVPGVYPIIQQKLRSGTLSADDRSSLHQLARLDLIELIENELGIQLKGSQKNSVAAMIDFLLGPEGGEASGRRRPRRRQALLMKRSRRGSGDLQVGSSARAAHQSEQLNEHPGAAHYESAAAAIKQERSDQPAGELPQHNTVKAAQDGFETEGSCPAGPNASVYSGEASRQQRYEQGQWLRELQMQLTAAHTAGDEADDSAALADDGTSTPQSAMVPPQPWLDPTVAAAQGPAAGSQLPQHNWYATVHQESLETKLLDQLLKDMQLSPQAHHQQQQQEALPQHLQGQQTSQVVQVQRQHQLNAPHVHLMQPLQSQQMQPQRKPSLQLPMQQPYGSSTSAAAAATMPSSGYHSCPLPGTVPPSTLGSWPSAMPALATAAADWGDYTANPFSTDTSLPGHVQQQQSSDWMEEATPSASLIKKRDRHQMTWHAAAAAAAVAAAAAQDPAAANLSVELSGPSAHVTTKRMSFVSPGTGSVSAVTTSTAGVAGAVDIQQSAAACSQQYVDTTADSNDDARMKVLLQQSPQLRQRSSFNKGMKGLARRVKAFLKSGNSKHHPQQLDGHMPAVDADPGHYSSANAPEVFGVRYGTVTHEPTVEGSMTEFSAASLPDFRLQSGTADLGSFALGRTTSAPGTYQPTMQQTYDGSQATAHLGSSSAYAAGGAGSRQSFAERLQLLRAMYDQQGMTQHPEAAGEAQTAMAATAGGELEALPVGLLMQQQLLFASMPALQEESETGSPAAAPGVSDDRKPSSSSPFLHKMTKALGINTKHTDKQEEATAALAASGLSLTERSNSSFSQFLAKVANSWRQDSSSTAAATIPLSSDTWPSTTTATGTLQTASTRLSSWSSHNRSFLQNMSFVQGSLPSVDGAAAAAAAVAATGVEQSRGSFSKLFGPCGGGEAVTGGVLVEPSSRSFSRVFGPCAGSAIPDTPSAGVAGSGPIGVDVGIGAAAAVAMTGVEQSRGSFSKLFGPCGGGEAVTAGVLVEPSSRSFSRVFGPCAGSAVLDTPSAAAAGSGPIGVEPTQGSYSKLLGMRAGRDTGISAPGLTAAPSMAVEGSRGSFSHLLGMRTGADTAAAAAATDEAGPGEADPGPGVVLLCDVGSGELVPGALSTADGVGQPH